MKILGIAGSARKSSRSGVYRLVSTILESTGAEFDLVHLPIARILKAGGHACPKKPPI